MIYRSPLRTAFYLAGAGLLLLVAGRSAVRLHTGIELARAAEPWQQAVARPQATLLVVGDSTAVGTGASAGIHSVAGRLARQWPRLRIENRATNGATFHDVLGQLETAPPGVDVILVQAGANDVFRWRDLDAVRQDIGTVARRARSLSGLVIVMPPGNVGNAPFFFRPLSWLMARRMRQLHQAVQLAATREGAVYVNLYRERAEDPFAHDHALMARDGLHPSDRGYALWYQELLAQSPLTQRLTGQPTRDTPLPQPAAASVGT